MKQQTIQEKHLRWIVEDIFQSLIQPYLPGKVEDMNVDINGIDIKMDCPYSTLHSFQFKDNQVKTFTCLHQVDIDSYDYNVLPLHYEQIDEHESTRYLLCSVPAPNIDILKNLFFLYQSYVKEEQHVVA